MHSLFLAMILGIVEGFTEFLPISSTGHLIVAERILHFKDPNDVFTTVIQIGAMAAVVWFFRKDIWQKIQGLFRKDKPAIHFWTILVLATIPAGLVGLILDKHMNSITTPTVVAITMIIGGVILWLVENIHHAYKQQQEIELEKVSTRQAVWVGLAQAVSIIPGTSRSGATITGGLLTGLDRPTAAAFSFYLGIPILFLASVFKLLKHGSEIKTVSGGWAAVIVGTIFAFITALLAISWLLRYISKHSFKPFAYYRIVMGTLILLFIH